MLCLAINLYLTIETFLDHLHHSLAVDEGGEWSLLVSGCIIRKERP